MLAMLTAALLAAPPITLGERHALVGVVSEQAHLSCKGGDDTIFGGGEEVWGDPYHEVGFVRLVPGPKVEAKGTSGKLVVALGAPADGPPPARPGGCHAMQMRSDWIYGKAGMRVARTTPPHVAFRADTLRVLDTMLTAERVPGAPGPADDRVAITLTNPFDRPLTDIALTVHHEGCYGKPGATADTGKRRALDPGAAWTTTLPAFVDQKQGRGRWHAAAAVTLMATAPNVAFDVDVPIHRLGIEIGCAELRAAPPAQQQQQQQQKTAP